MATTESGVHSTDKPQIELSAKTGSLLEWPRSLWLYGAALGLLFFPALSAAFQMWMNDSSYSHGVFIPCLSAFIIYLQRDRIRELPMKPTLWGFLPLLVGLFLYSSAWLLQIDLLLFWTLIPTLIGTVLLLHGWPLLRITLFPILYLAFAAQLPWMVLNNLNMWVKKASTMGAVTLMQGLGFTILQTGNLVEIPGHALEVADVCSGYKKLMSLLAFAVLYSFLFRISLPRRIVLVLMALPIAVVSNALRIGGLIAVTSFWGEKGLKIAHDWAEIVALGIAFGLFVLVGKILGCREIRFMPSSDS